MILEDKLLVGRLASEPEFAFRLHEFLLLRGLEEKAVLVVQARPSHTSSVNLDLSRTELVEKFRSGLENQDNRWEGFNSRVHPQPTFHGLAGMSSRSDPYWITELHRDGHFLAASWLFPEVSGDDGIMVPAIADFYSEFFRQFATFVTGVLEVGRGDRAYSVTATLVNAPRLHFAGKSWGRHYVITSPPIRLSNLQWPVLYAEVGTAAWQALGGELGAALYGAYGYEPGRMGCRLL